MSIPVSKATFILLDTETTDPARHVPVEIGGLRWRRDEPMRPENLKETLINPGCKIDPLTRSVHHISDEDVLDAPRLEDVDSEWGEFVGDSVIVAYNAEFDRGVLASTCLANRQWLDAYRMAMHFWFIGQENEDGFKLSSLKQQELRYWLKLPATFGDAHRAGADVQVTAHLLGRAIDAYLECGMKDDLQAFMDYINGPICHMTLPIGGFNYSGKTPEEVDDRALRKAFDADSVLFESFARFNVHECLLPEYISRFGHAPGASAPETTQKKIRHGK